MQGGIGIGYRICPRDRIGRVRDGRLERERKAHSGSTSDETAATTAPRSECFWRVRGGAGLREVAEGWEGLLVSEKDRQGHGICAKLALFLARWTPWTPGHVRNPPPKH